MFVVIRHNITDPKKREEATTKIGPLVEQGQCPKGLKGLFYLPSTDGRKAECLWEADSVAHLQSFLEPYVATAARNEYFQINVEHAFSLPGDCVKTDAAQ
jgi:hypothetical protein